MVKWWKAGLKSCYGNVLQTLFEKPFPLDLASSEQCQKDLVLRVSPSYRLYTVML